MMTILHSKHSYRTPQPAKGIRENERERQTERSGSVRHYSGWEGKEFVIGFEGSQAVLARPSGRGKAFDRYY
jgi:hypothetical protein